MPTLHHWHSLSKSVEHRWELSRSSCHSGLQRQWVFGVRRPGNGQKVYGFEFSILWQDYDCWLLQLDWKHQLHQHEDQSSSRHLRFDIVDRRHQPGLRLFDVGHCQGWEAPFPVQFGQWWGCFGLQRNADGWRALAPNQSHQNWTNGNTPSWQRTHYHWSFTRQATAAQWPGQAVHW